jgi:uncharacterized protein YyaL (SSP411 family)
MLKEMEDVGDKIVWREWGEEAFAEAREKNRPLLLDISAVWCHWCHVMDETTYAHPGVIALINAECVPVRVDNDLRPDINARYNSGGWPTTVFLTASGDILAGATYMTAEQMLDALHKVTSYHRTHQMEIASASLEARKRSGLGVARSAGELRPKAVDEVVGSVVAAYDPEFGGFGLEPKFPMTEALVLLLEQSHLRQDERLRSVVQDSLAQMAKGGLHDGVEGGFFRYSTTRDWSVPHYEKMLEDQVGLVMALARAGMQEVLGETLGWLDQVLRNPDSHLHGGSQDADEEYYKLDMSARSAHGAPTVDRRVNVAWNAHLAVALLEAAAFSGQEGLRERARGIMAELKATRYHIGEGWEHADGVGGLLADQAWGLLACVRAYQWGLGEQWLQVAQEMASVLEARWGDGVRGGYFDIAHTGAGRLGERMKPLNENAVVALALSELDTLVDAGGQGHRQQARRALESVAGLVERNGPMAALWARVVDRLEPSVKVSTKNWEVAAAALKAHPYVVIDPQGGESAVVCVGTSCVASGVGAGEVDKALKDAWLQERSRRD